MTAIPTTEDTPSALRDEVLARFVRRDGPAWSDADEASFTTWLQADARHREAYARWQSHWHTLDAVDPHAVARLKAGIARDKANEDERERAATALAAQARRRFGRLAFGGVAAVVVATCAGIFGWSAWQSQPTYQQSFATTRGQQTELSLPDGTRLRLDTATRLDVTYFRNRRTLHLREGQAVFTVQPDPARPFSVEAGPVVATAVGTRYLVRYTPQVAGHEDVRVAVEEGRVRVAAAGAGRRDEATSDTSSLVLSAGQQVFAEPNGILSAAQAVSAEGFAPWRENKLSFVDVPLSQALAEFERYAPTRLEVSEPSVGALRLSGTFDVRDSQLLRRMLPAALPIRLKDLGDGRFAVVPSR